MLRYGKGEEKGRKERDGTVSEGFIDFVVGSSHPVAVVEAKETCECNNVRS